MVSCEALLSVMDPMTDPRDSVQVLLEAPILFEVGGEAVHAPMAVLEDQTLRVGDVRMPVPRLIVREEMGSAQGLVGMDVLRGTVLMVSADRDRPVSWLVPPSRT